MKSQYQSATPMLSNASLKRSGVISK
jgi:hypothetical protein